MEALKSKYNLLVIVGPTASGKTALAIDVAKEFKAEVVCADSRTIYRGMDIGTAKPTIEETGGIPHHLLDVVEPGQPFNVADFKLLAEKAINKINKKNKLAILVGGTGLYINSVIYNYKFGTPPNSARRLELSKLSLQELQAEARKVGVSPQDIDYKNPRHLLRAVENRGILKQDNKLRAKTLLIGLNPPKEVLRRRIIDRTDNMIESGFLEELEQVVNNYGWQDQAMTAIGYNAFKDFLSGEKDLESSKLDFVNGDKKLAKRQLTWFKRNKNIVWFDNAKKAEKYIYHNL